MKLLGPELTENGLSGHSRTNGTGTYTDCGDEACGGESVPHVLDTNMTEDEVLGAL